MAETTSTGRVTDRSDAANASAASAYAHATAAELGDALESDEVKALRAIVEGTARATGAEFFRTLCTHLAAAVDARGAFVAEFCGPTRVRALSLLWRGEFIDGHEWDLDGTPCKDVLAGRLCHYPSGVERLYPKEKGVDSYLGVPLLDANGKTLGHMAVIDDRPMPAEPKRLFTFRIFAARAAAELERLSTERRLKESEQRFRDLFEEAPIAYVHEGLDSRFLTANRAAMRILGIKPEEVPGTIGKSLVADTPENQKRLQEAFASIGKGVDTGGVVLELRRKDNGAPIFIQWWSKPDPSGEFTRTMFVDITDKVLMEREKAVLETQNQYLREEIKQSSNAEEIVSRSGALQRVMEDVRQVAPTDASVLITGETGTGKELMARAIHANSQRHAKPLIKLNCAALPAGLVESELFGHERGAFSGAIQRRIGRFELAHGGTIFLDEIGELPLDLQAKLLRVLQEREFERVGGSQPIKVDVRIIAATNRDLASCVRDGTFREDLFYRLNVFPVAIPPLRDRRDDIPLLVAFLVEKFRTRVSKTPVQVDAETLERLCAYRWPGNVRELENVIERAVILCRGDKLVIDPSVLESHVAPAQISVAAPTAPGGLQQVERDHIVATLRACNWLIEGDRGAAKRLGLHPNTLRSRLKKLGITREN